MKELSNEYVAGFFDGEGCVFLQTWGSLEVRITQVDKTPLDLIKQKYGGIVKPLAVSGNSTSCFQWSIMRWIEGVKFLQIIRPYLIVKAEQVDEVLRYYETAISENLTLRRGSKRLTPQQHLDRENLRIRLSEMKGGRSRRKVP